MDKEPTRRMAGKCVNKCKRFNSSMGERQHWYLMITIQKTWLEINRSNKKTTKLIHLFNKCLLQNYSMSSTVLGPRV